MLSQSLVGRICEWRMITPSLQGDAVNGIMANLVNGHALLKTGILLWKDYIITLPGFKISIIGTLWREIVSSATILRHRRMHLLVIGKSSFVKENDNALNVCLFLGGIFYCN